MILERPVTPQQARNILNRMHGKQAADKLLQTIIDAFAEYEGNGVTLLQDQLGITVGIVMQSAQQKLCFELWGECLVMDWTHGSNNIGYQMNFFVLVL